MFHKFFQWLPIGIYYFIIGDKLIALIILLVSLVIHVYSNIQFPLLLLDLFCR
jgi:hypothetical protein